MNLTFSENATKDYVSTLCNLMKNYPELRLAVGTSAQCCFPFFREKFISPCIFMENILFTVFLTVFSTDVTPTAKSIRILN